MEKTDSGTQLSSELRNALLKEGASLVGFADLTPLSPESRQSLDYAVSIGVALNPAVIRRIGLNGPGHEYSYEKVRANGFLNYLGELTVELLQGRGYTAVSLGADQLNTVDQKTLSTQLPHKTVATRAGLGWIGKPALLVTEEYGSALRLNTVLTNAALEYGAPVEASKCGPECEECAKACPAKAIKGNLWDLSKSKADALSGRSHLVEIMACAKYYIGYSKKLGLEPPRTVCGLCMAACPKTKRYLSKHSFID